MKKKQIFVGIDVSKSTLDVFIRNAGFHFVAANDPSGFAELLGTICKVSKCKPDEILFCFENTGKYSKMLSVFLHSQELTFFMEPALAIKRSMGMSRGKNDKVDAKRIAEYAYEKKHKLTPANVPGEKIDRMKNLLTLREKLIKHRTAFKNGITDRHDCYSEGENSFVIGIQENQIKLLDEDIKKVEEEIEHVIKSDASILKNYKLVISVKGIAKINAFYFIAYTVNFTLFASPRAYACYCGIAPFENSSGTIKGRTKVHHFANKQLKSLLNLAASSAIQVRGEYQAYYNRRVNELGKSKMSTLNIIRNKLVNRVFAVIKRQTPYVDLSKFAT